MRKITFFAFAGRCARFGASGPIALGAAESLDGNSDVNATLPRLAPSE